MKTIVAFAGGLLALAACKGKIDSLAPPTVTASFIAPPTLEVGYPFVFQNMSQNATSYKWDFGEGSAISTEVSPTYVYSYPGTHTVTLRAYDAHQNVATASQTITILNTYLPVPAPVKANFTIPANVVDAWPASFQNTSQNATTYKWSFGDGNTATTTSPTHTYAKEGTYTVTLRAYNTNQDSAVNSQIVIVARNVITHAPSKVLGDYYYSLVTVGYYNSPTPTITQSRGTLTVAQTGPTAITISKVSTTIPFTYDPDPANPTIYRFSYHDDATSALSTTFGPALFYPTGDSMHINLTTYIGAGSLARDTYHCYR